MATIGNHWDWIGTSKIATKKAITLEYKDYEAENGSSSNKRKQLHELSKRITIWLTDAAVEVVSV